MRKRVLVVDDDPSIRASLKKVLEAAGYDVLLAADSQEASNLCDSNCIGLLILDLRLPITSGWETFESLTRRNPYVPVIVVTGLANQFTTALAVGAGALLEKPIRVPVLLETMEKLLAESDDDRLRRLCGYRDDTRYVPSADAPPRRLRGERIVPLQKYRLSRPLSKGACT
ncbi:MAG: response regulator [Verrucomicrobia bacterium]|nr:response regulator [Verrucomicrobiota bacterium]